MRLIGISEYPIIGKNLYNIKLSLSQLKVKKHPPVIGSKQRHNYFKPETYLGHILQLPPHYRKIPVRIRIPPTSIKQAKVMLIFKALKTNDINLHIYWQLYRPLLATLCV